MTSLDLATTVCGRPSVMAKADFRKHARFTTTFATTRVGVWKSIHDLSPTWTRMAAPTSSLLATQAYGPLSTIAKAASERRNSLQVCSVITKVGASTSIQD